MGVIGLVLGLHACLFFALSYVPQTPLAIPKPPIPVQLVLIDPAPKPLETIPETPEIVAPPIKREPIKPEPEPELEREFESKPELESPPAEIIVVIPTPPTPPLVEPLRTEEPQVGTSIPERWRLPSGASISLDKTVQPNHSELGALAKSLDCLGFDADCAAQRKSIFAEDQLSGTDLVWMASHPHSGLSNSDLYGLSEGQIRKRLGITSAGENGFMLLPGIVIDGPWWDALHGVNKACDYGLGLDENGQKQLVKKCKPLKPSSKDRIGFIPKPVE